MKRLSTLLALSVLFTATALAQPSTSFPVRKACREVVPQVLYVLGADQVTATPAGPGRTLCIFSRHLGGTDSVLVRTDSLPRCLLAAGPHWSLRFDLARERIYIRTNMVHEWVLQNTNGAFYKEFDLNHLKEVTPDRFFLEAIACSFMVHAGLSDLKQEADRAPGRLSAVAYSYLPTRGIEGMESVEASLKSFCPLSDESYSGKGAEISPYGSIQVCYKKSGR